MLDLLFCCQNRRNEQKLCQQPLAIDALSLRQQSPGGAAWTPWRAMVDHAVDHRAATGASSRARDALGPAKLHKGQGRRPLHRSCA